MGRPIKILGFFLCLVAVATGKCSTKARNLQRWYNFLEQTRDRCYPWKQHKKSWHKLRSHIHFLHNLHNYIETFDFSFPSVESVDKCDCNFILYQLLPILFINV